MRNGTLGLELEYSVCSGEHVCTGEAAHSTMGYFVFISYI